MAAKDENSVRLVHLLHPEDMLLYTSLALTVTQCRTPCCAGDARDARATPPCQSRPLLPFPPCPPQTHPSPPTWSGWASCAPPASSSPPPRSPATGPRSTGTTPKANSGCDPAWRNAPSTAMPPRSPCCRTSAPSRKRCWTGASPAKAYAGTPETPLPPEFEVHLPDTGETLRPRFAVRKAATGPPANQQAPSATEAPANNGNGESPWQLLVSTTARTETFDTVVRTKGGSDASAHGRMERLLRAAPAAPARDGRTPPPRGQPATRAGLQLG